MPVAVLRAQVHLTSVKGLKPTELPPAKATIKVHVASCKGIKVADEADGTSDPYVIVKLPNNATARTKTIHKSVEPKFDETLEFSVDNIDAIAANEKGLTLSLYDKNFLIDEPLGEVEPLLITTSDHDEFTAEALDANHRGVDVRSL